MTIDWIRAAFGIVSREVPGHRPELREYLQQAPPQVQEQFFRLLQFFETELANERRRARSPWRLR